MKQMSLGESGYERVKQPKAAVQTSARLLPARWTSQKKQGSHSNVAASEGYQRASPAYRSAR